LLVSWCAGSRCDTADNDEDLGRNRRPNFPTGGFHTHFEPRHLYGTRFPRHGCHPTRSNGDVHKIVKTSSGRMVKCWIPKIVDMDSSCSRHMIGNNK
jgi:hypothetical protein